MLQQSRRSSMRINIWSFESFLRQWELGLGHVRRFSLMIWACATLTARLFPRILTVDQMQQHIDVFTELQLSASEDETFLVQELVMRAGFMAMTQRQSSSCSIGKILGHQDTKSHTEQVDHFLWMSLELCAKNLFLLARLWIPVSAVMFFQQLGESVRWRHPGMWQRKTGCFTMTVCFTVRSTSSTLHPPSLFTGFDLLQLLSVPRAEDET